MTEFCEKLQAKGFIPMGSENKDHYFLEILLVKNQL